MDFAELRQTLTGKGGAAEDTKRDHAFYYITVDGKQERATKISHGASGQIDASLLSLIAHQMRLTAPELRRFQACTLTPEEWLAKWATRPTWGRPGAPLAQTRRRRRRRGS